MSSASSIASAIANSSKYDYVGSDYSMSSGKGTTSSYKAATTPSASFYSGGILGAIGRNTSNSTVKATVDAITGASAPGSAPNSPSAVSKLLGSSVSSSSSSGYSGSSGGGYSVSYSVPAPISYIDAPFAEAYGMSASTAYQEALSNNAVRRRVNDLKAAGLNPVLGISNQGATSFYGVENQPDIGAISSFGGYGYGSSGSGKSSSFLASVGNQVIRNLPNLVGGVVTLATKGNLSKGYAAHQIATGISNIFRFS